MKSNSQMLNDPHTLKPERPRFMSWLHHSLVMRPGGNLPNL